MQEFLSYELLKHWHEIDPILYLYLKDLRQVCAVFRTIHTRHISKQFLQEQVSVVNNPEQDETPIRRSLNSLSLLFSFQSSPNSHPEQGCSRYQITTAGISYTASLSSAIVTIVWWRRCVQVVLPSLVKVLFWSGGYEATGLESCDRGRYPQSRNSAS